MNPISKQSWSVSHVGLQGYIFHLLPHEMLVTNRGNQGTIAQFAVSMQYAPFLENFFL